MIMKIEERIWWVAIVAILAWTLTMTIVNAQTTAQEALCGPAEEVFAYNEQKGHVMSFAGLDFEGNLLTIWTSDENGQYGILLTDAEGLTCYINGGTTLGVTPAGEPM